MFSEFWVDIKGYEGIYQISSHGNVRSVPRQKRVGRELKKQIIKKYYCVHLSKNGQRKIEFVHILVAEHFVANPFKKPIVAHLTHNSLINNFYTLGWMTQKENVDYDGTNIGRFNLR